MKNLSNEQKKALERLILMFRIFIKEKNNNNLNKPCSYRLNKTVYQILDDNIRDCFNVLDNLKVSWKMQNIIMNIVREDKTNSLYNNQIIENALLILN